MARFLYFFHALPPQVAWYTEPSWGFAEMHLIVLCGGFGARLGSLTTETPKPMITVAGRPFLEHLLDQFQRQGITGIEMAVSFQWQKISNYFGDNWRGIPIRYAVEPQPLGTGGAIRNAMAHAGVEEALIVNGDTLFLIDFVAFLKFAKSHEAATVMALRYVPDCSRYGRVTVRSDGKILNFGEKDHAGPGLINAGIYYQRADALAPIATEVFSFETDYLAVQHRLQPLYAIPMEGYFIDIGIPADLQRAQAELRHFALP
jgi:D-glycero-alpha-D-manno-heptose 1-phosphate guanylyltransferase